MDNVAVVAHFDANDRVEANFIELLTCLSKRFDHVILVTTSEIREDIAKNLPKVITIRRPNFGYDFFSYRVGLNYAEKNFEVQSILLVNSSFAILSSQIFDRTLAKMLELKSEYDVVGSSESYQFSWHLQSYLILLGSSVLRSAWFEDFLAGVEPTGSKFETITRFEIGLSSAFRSNNVKATAILQPSPEQLERASQQWSAGDRQYASGPAFLSSATSPAQRFNPVHHLAELVARELGYAKLEVLRDNPITSIWALSMRFVSKSVLAKYKKCSTVANPTTRAEVTTFLLSRRRSVAFPK